MRLRSIKAIVNFQNLKQNIRIVQVLEPEPHMGRHTLTFMRQKNGHFVHWDGLLELRVSLYANKDGFTKDRHSILDKEDGPQTAFY